MDLIEAALAHAAKGRHVFPVSWQKVPLVQWGPNSKDPATTDPDTIRRWWGKYETAMIGMAVGPSGIFVLDVDCKDGANGMQSLEGLQNVLGELPETLTVETASGGLHFYFAMTPRLESAKNIAVRDEDSNFDGIDWRTKGGYVIVPPSKNDVGTWRFRGPAPIANLPSEWVDAILEEGKKSRAKTDAAIGTGVIPEGARDSTLFRIGARMRASGENLEGLVERLSEINAARCKPALLPGQVEKIAQSVVDRYDPNTLMTDQGNGIRLAQHLENRAMFVDGPGVWYEYNGHVWVQSHTHAPTGWAAELTRNMRVEADSIGDEKARELAFKWAVTSETAGRVAAMANMAKSPELLGVKLADLDADPYAWNMAGSTLVLDQETGGADFHAHRPEDLVTKIGGASGKPAECSLWLEHLEKVLPDPAQRDYFQRAIGYTLEPGQPEKIMHVVFGPADSGKSMTMRVLARVFGDYQSASELNAFVPVEGGGKNNPQLFELRGVRLVIVSEIPAERQFESSVLKSWTGGDPQRAAPKYGRPVTFMPEGKLIFTGNHLPHIKATDAAAWRRLRIVEFAHSIPLDEQDATLEHRFNLDGVWSWIVEGWMAYRELGLVETASMEALKNRSKTDANPLVEFVEECLERDPKGTIRAATLYTALRSFSQTNRERPMRMRGRLECLAEMGLVIHRTAAGNVYKGWRFTTTGQVHAGIGDDGLDGPSVKH